MNKKCLGCGSILQCENKNQVGYIPDLKKDAIYCERCFRLLHYHEISMDCLTITNEELLKQAIQYQKPIYYFMDLFQISKEALSPFFQIPGEKYLILTKIDLIPKTISVERLIRKIKKIYNINDNIFSYTRKSEKLLKTLLNHIKQHQTSILLGMTNAGKSSFLKEAVRYLNHDNCPILVSEMPNTTLSFLSFNVGNFTLIDAPGFSFQMQWSKDISLKMVPKKYLKPVTIQMKKETILNFEDIIFISQNLEKNSFTFYGNNEFQLKKIYQLKETNEIIEKMKIPEKCDLVLPGIGFFSVSKSCDIIIQSKEKIMFEIRPSFLGGNYD